MGKRLEMIAAVITCAALCLSIADAQVTDQRAIRVDGAAVSADQVQAWAKEFSAANPGINIVVQGTSAGKGIKSLIDGSAEVAIASRDLNDSEKKAAAERGLQLQERLIGYSGVSVVTSPKNPVDELTIEQLKQIFTGEITNWKQVGGPDAPIKMLSTKVPESGGAVFFQQRVMDGKPFSPNTNFMESFYLIVKVCSISEDLTIGIAPAAWGAKGTKLIAVKKDATSPGVRPSEQTVRDRSYPITLPFKFYWNGRSVDQRVTRFVDFCVSKGLGGQDK
ncbi:MAG: PstS family phosphate ABC transporter substrate-binding protein [Desulfomonile sp.]|nr:PstS family phosphate ABC transporter substrate-binding protein [Desulfomonile sp.]